MRFFYELLDGTPHFFFGKKPKLFRGLYFLFGYKWGIWDWTLERSGTSAELGAVEQVKEILREVLADGPVPASECKRQIKDGTAITGEGTISRARNELGVRSIRKGNANGAVWFWYLKGHEGQSEEMDRRNHVEARRAVESRDTQDIDSKGSRKAPGPTFREPLRVGGAEDSG